MVPDRNNGQDSFLDLIHAELKNRNSYETEPFVSLHASNKALQQLVDMLEAKYETLEKNYTSQKLQLEEFKHNIEIEGGGSGDAVSKNSNTATSALIRNEARLREKLEKIQEELQNALRTKSEDTQKALEVQQELSILKDLKLKNEKTISNLTEDVDRAQTAMSHLQQQLEDAKSNHHLAEQQYEGLKTSIREYQTENDSLVKENHILVERVVTEKEKVSGEINVLNEMVEKLKLEVEMLRSYQTLETQRQGDGTTKTNVTTVVGGTTANGNKVSKFFGKALHGGSKKGAGSAPSLPIATNRTTSTPNNPQTGHPALKPSTTMASPHKWCEMGVVLPTTPKFNIKAYSAEATCIRYDPELDLCCTSGTDMDHHGVGGIKTAGTTSTIKVWNTSKGVQTTTLHVSGGLSSFGRSSAQQNMILTCDMGGGLVVGGSTDKTCRVWNLQTSRMIHQLVGHSHKVTCARLLPHLKAVLTGSADRSLKLWDIARSTYRQTLTFHPQATPNCIDVLMSSSGTTTTVTKTTSSTSGGTTLAVSGQTDGSLKFWDLQRGDNRCVQDIPYLHGDGGGGIVSAQFSPVTPTQVLTCGKDNTLKIIDTRRVQTSSHLSSGHSSPQALVEMRHHDFFVGGGSGHGGAASVAALSPDGKYAIAGSSSDGTIFVWRVLDGSLERTISPDNLNIVGEDSKDVNCATGHNQVGICGLAWGHCGTSGQQVASVDRKGHLVLWA